MSRLGLSPFLLLCLLVESRLATAQEGGGKAAEKKGPLATATFGGLKLRSLGPAVTSGRVAAFAVHPTDRSHYFVAAASGGVWKTVNAGVTWTPVFDNEGSYSIGAITLDPKNPSVVWVGTGENNSQRSVSYGDGLYRSDDGGKSWKNVGLKTSEHIGKILIDPRSSQTVYVAAQGPLWSPGGDRGLYKTTDGGASWKCVLPISENTGVTDVVLDPRNPDVLIAAAYQRRRAVWTLINGGPESALYKSTDGGATWRKLTSGLPTENLGRIGLALAPSNPDMVYASVESIDGKGGIFRSNDRGETWERRNGYDQQAQYYAHLVVDPKNSERVYVMSVFLQVSDDGAKTLRGLGEKWKHVDNHAIWIDPKHTDYYLVGCDGGVYESFDRGANWRFQGNLPITQFYDITVDEGGPFYHVYGGTQDNFTLGGPARTRSVHGITNADWFVTQGGDGFHCKVDPKDTNTVYCELQYGVLTRFDRRTGQNTGIQPQPGAGEPPLRWNWDSPLLLSPHQHTRLYFAANRVFKSDDRGDTWKAISGDLSRQLDRDKLPVMGKLWGPDAVARHVSTSFYGNITALTESPGKEGLLYAGTDDGLVQVTENGGGAWRKIDTFPGVPERTYVSRLLASTHQAETVYAAFDNHKSGDFAPYLLRSTDAGRTWTSIAGDLPARGSVLAIADDHQDPNLLFAGTEFGLYFTIDGGKKWVRLKGGLPTIAVKDLAIQRQQNDLAVGTFGRGIYILDDYTPLRGLKPETLEQGSVLFPVRSAQLYIETRQYGLRGKAFQGSAFYTADNPPYGAMITYYLKETIKTLKQKRRDAEKEAEKKGGKVTYATKEQLRAEAEEEPPTILVTISDAGGQVVRTLTGPVTQGIHRQAWDLRVPSATVPKPRPKESDDDLFIPDPSGHLVLPGAYKVSLARRVGGVVTPLEGEQQFSVVVEGAQAMNPDDAKVLLAFQQKVSRLQRTVSGTLETANELSDRLDRIKRGLDHTPGVELKWKDAVRALEKQNREILRALRGDTVLQARNENVPESISDRVGYIVSSQRFALSRPTATQQEAYEIASKELARELGKLRTIVTVELRDLERALDAAGVPWTPGRLPEWKDR
jgi:photosystem II stability/assembly factor-like uncharacterized protein